jgi:hypothetical protein
VQKWIDVNIHGLAWLGMFGLEILFGLAVGYLAMKGVVIAAFVQAKFKK